MGKVRHFFSYLSLLSLLLWLCCDVLLVPLLSCLHCYPYDMLGARKTGEGGVGGREREREREVDRERGSF